MHKDLQYALDRMLAKLSSMPYMFLGLTSALCLVGVLEMVSAGQGSFAFASKQLLNILLFIPIVLIIAVVDMKTIFRFSYLAYGLGILLLVLVNIIGHKSMGATRWINLGIIKLQPSEIMKICLVLAVARFYHDQDRLEQNSLISLAKVGLLIALPVLLILKQPDLGTAIITSATVVTMMFFTGISIWLFVGGGALVLAAMPLIWNLMHDYQKKRVLTFLDPENDPLGSGYNIIQSKIAIGSGGLFGKGYAKGTQTQLDFLPEHQTDFVFTMFLEEWGFVGGLFTLALFMFLISNMYIIGISARAKFAQLLTLGLASLVFWHIAINIGMVSGLLPVVGNPLPYISYGGNIMLIMMITTGLVCNVSIHRNNVISTNRYSFC